MDWSTPFPEEWKGFVEGNLEHIGKKDMASVIDQRRDFLAGTTSIQAADASGWVVSITPSGGWLPACIAGNTGVGLSQRMQSFVLHPKDGPYNVLEPGKRPRATLTPTLALKNHRPYLCFSVQGGRYTGAKPGPVPSQHRRIWNERPGGL